MPKLLSFLAIHCLIGIAVAGLLVLGLIWTDAAGLGTLILKSQEPWIALITLGVGFSITFGSVSMATAIMSLPFDQDG